MSSERKTAAADPRRVDSIARDHGRLGGILRRTEAYIALNGRIAGVIPNGAQGEIGIACVEEDCLVIAAASPARATQARLAADAILDAARSCWPRPLNRARVIVAPGISLRT